MGKLTLKTPQKLQKKLQNSKMEKLKNWKTGKLKNSKTQNSKVKKDRKKIQVVQDDEEFGVALVVPTLEIN